MPYQNPFPNPWEYHGVPKEDLKDLMQLYRHTYLVDMERLPRALQQFTYPPGYRFPRGYEQFNWHSQSQNATQAAMFFLISDFIATYYEAKHPNFEMKEIPKEVLVYLRPPYNRMTHLDIDSQKRFRASLPPEQRHLIYIDE